MNKLKKGLTYISERGSFYRYSDKVQDEKWLKPLSEYIPLEEIMRGQPVSIATEEDIRLAAKKIADEYNKKYPEEPVKESFINSTLMSDSNTFVVLTSPNRHKNTIGLSYEYTPAPQYDGEQVILSDKIHILEIGQFDIDPDYLLKSHQVGSTEQLIAEVINKEEYIPEFFTHTYKELIGQQIYIKGISGSEDKPGLLTINKEEAYIGYNNIIKVGFISDAWLNGTGGAALKAGDAENAADQENTDKYSFLNNSVSIQVQVQGDDRGALDSTLFEGILGEDVYIPSTDKVRVFAYGQEDDVKFSARINITPNNTLNLSEIGFDISKEFIGFQKMDGKTALVTFSPDFTIEKAKDTGINEDNAFLAIAEVYDPDFRKTDRIFTADYSVEKVSPTAVKAAIDSIESKLNAAWESIFETKAGLDFEHFTPAENGQSGYIKLTAKEAGGYYYMYISDKLKSYFMIDSYTLTNGSSNNKNTVVLADNRIASRQNIIGVYNSGNYDVTLTKGTKCVFMHDGLFRYENHPYTEFFGNSTIGCEYFLGRNGTIRRFADTAYDTVVKVLDVQDENKLVVHCDNARVRTRGGDLPLGYMKPAVRIGDEFVAEYGFVLMDGGKTRYPYKAYEALYKRLTALYPTNKLDLRIVAGETEETFIIPKCTTITDDTLSPSIIQIKAVEDGIYEKEPRIPYIRTFGTFEGNSEDKQITIDEHTYLQGVSIPTIGKYTVKSNIGTKDEKTEDIDTRFEITPICDLTIIEDGVEDPTIENLDIHLYVDPEYDISHSTVYHWVELRTGFHNFNNNTTYGFEWKIEKEEPNKNNPFGRYYLSTNIKNGMGLYYQTSTNVVPTPLSGMPWKLTVGRRENVAQQYDLNGVMHAYLSSRAEDEKGNPFTTKAVTGEAVIHAIENHYRVRNLEAYPDVADDAEQKSHIYLGKETAPATDVSLSAVNQIVEYSPNGIKFETSLKTGNKEDQKVVFRENWFEVIPGTDDNGTNLPIKEYGQLKDNQYTTKAQVQEHLDEDAVKGDVVVHGMIFGAKGNVDASLFNSLPLGTHHQARVISNRSDTIKDASDHPSYIDYNYYGTDPINGTSTYITNQEGTIVHNKADIAQESNKSNNGVYATEAYDEITGQNIDETLIHTETVNTNYKVFKKQVKGTGPDNKNRALETRYNFTVDSKASDPSEFSSNNAYDIEFNKIDGDGKVTPASIKVGSIGVTSRAEFKHIYGELVNPYDEGNFHLEGAGDNLFKNNNDNKEYFGSALQAAYEIPTACWQYKNEPNWYKKYLGIVIDRVNDIRDKLTTENYRNIFTEKDQHYWAGINKETGEYNDPKSTKPFNSTDNKYTYSEAEIKSIKSYLNAITDNAESAQNIISTVGLLLQSAKETQERLLKVEASTFGADAPTIPGQTKNFVFPETPDVTPEATHLGLNRLIRAMAIELYGTANPDDNKLKDINESNNTSTTLSRLDTLEVELEGKTFDTGADTDAADNELTSISSATYPYEVNTETVHGGITRTEKDRIDFIPCVKNEDGSYTYHSHLKDTDITVKDVTTLYYLDKNDTEAEELDKYKLCPGLNELSTLGQGDELYAKEKLVDILGNQNPIDGRAAIEGEIEDSENHGTWTKINFNNATKFEQVDGKFIADTTHNLVPEENRNEFNGTIDAISRICTKVNALTYTINGKNNINSTPERLNTIRNNIETLIKEAYFDGAPETSVVDGIATTEAKEISQCYIDEDLDHTDTDRTLFAQPSQPYELKKEKNGKGKNYTGVSRFDQLSKDLYDYVIGGFDDSKNTVFTSVNYKDNNANGTSIQYTTEDDVKNKGASKKQVLVGRKFNGKQLLVDGIEDSVGADVSSFNQTMSDADLPTSFHINVPDSIEEYQYASIIDILIDALGTGYFRYQIYKDQNTSREELRPTETITERIEAIEKALDNVTHKLSQSNYFEDASEKPHENDLLSNEYKDKKETYSIEAFINNLNDWLGLHTKQTKNIWDQSTSAEIACGYSSDKTANEYTYYYPVTDGKYVDKDDKINDVTKDTKLYVIDDTSKEYREKTEEDTGYTTFVKETVMGDPLYYLNSADPIRNSNYVIKQLLKRLRKEESYYTVLTEILGKDYDIEEAKGNIEVTINEKTGLQEITGKSEYNLTDDIKDLLLTIYGTDNKEALTTYKHRSTVDHNDFRSATAWKDVNDRLIFTSEAKDLNVGWKAYNTGDLREEFGTISDYSNDSITVNNTVFTRDKSSDVKESGTNPNTRFTGGSDHRNIIDDIIKETYYVPEPIKFESKAKTEVKDGVTTTGYDENTTYPVDSIGVNYDAQGNNTYYDFDSRKYHYDYEHKAGDETGGRMGKAIGYNNRDTLFCDYKGKSTEETGYRRSRFEVLEDEIRHLRSFLGLNEIINASTIGNEKAAKTVYGGHFYGTSDTDLAGHTFSGGATRNGNFFAKENAASTPNSKLDNTTADSNLLTMVFNLSNALRDISRELGTETNYLGQTTSTVDGKPVDYDKFEQLNKEREMPIYERLKSLEDITGSLLGWANKKSPQGNKGEDDNEDDYDDGTINIQWIEE